MSDISPTAHTRKQITRRQRLCRWQDESKNARDLPPVLRRVFENRNIQTHAELDYSLNRLHSPRQLKGIEAATELLQSAIERKQKILVVGDYDTDGATATTVALLGLRSLGAEQVQYLAPNRFEYGYGLSKEIAEVALTQFAGKPDLGKPDLVVTVDNGIASVEGVARLRAAGVSVIVTDHHLAGAKLPDANAIVNPNQPGCGFPSKALAGVGVMFYLLLSVRSALRTAGRFQDDPQPNLADLLDLVALGTVADMVPLDYNNRILVAQGVARVRAGRCRPGIKALLEVAGKAVDHFSASDFGFVIAPRLNAAGRIDDISTGIECLLADDYNEATEQARLLDEMNRERRQLEQSMQARARQMVAGLDARERDDDDDHNDTKSSFNGCLFDPEWHQGIVGLVANRMREKSNRPVIAFAPADNGWLRGSARSVPGLHMRDLLESISMRCPQLIEKFGGHAMAAGLTIATKNFSTFAQHFAEKVDAHFKNNPPTGDIVTDGELAAEEFTLAIAELMRSASPWGQHFPAPLFDGEFRVIEQRVVAGQHLKMKLAPINGSQPSDALDAIIFRYVEPGEEVPRLATVQAAYQLQVNEFKGKRSLQLLVEHLQPCAA